MLKARVSSPRKAKAVTKKSNLGGEKPPFIVPGFLLPCGFLSQFPSRGPQGNPSRAHRSEVRPVSEV